MGGFAGFNREGAARSFYAILGIWSALWSGQQATILGGYGVNISVSVVVAWGWILIACLLVTGQFVERVRQWSSLAVVVGLIVQAFVFMGVHAWVLAQVFLVFSVLLVPQSVLCEQVIKRAGSFTAVE